MPYGYLQKVYFSCSLKKTSESLVPSFLLHPKKSKSAFAFPTHSELKDMTILSLIWSFSLLSLEYWRSLLTTSPIQA
jgi:hypothetical protein